MKIDAKKITDALRIYATNHKYGIANSYIFNWESDFFSVTKTGTVYEYEIKCTKADFKADFEKRKHFFLKNYRSGIFLERGNTVSGQRNDRWENEIRYDGHRPVFADFTKIEWHDSSNFVIPGKFYYVCPEGLLSVYDIPEYAGLMTVGKNGYVTSVIKSAPKLHKRGLKELGLIPVMMDKFYWLSENMRREHRMNEFEFSCAKEKVKNYEKLLKENNIVVG